MYLYLFTSTAWKFICTVCSTVDTSGKYVVYLVDWLQSLKQFFINVPYHTTCSQSNSDGSVLKQSHQS